VAAIEDGAPGDQQLGSCFDHCGHGLVSDATIDFDTEIQVPLGA
jgi:hypothetical protein